MSEKFDPIKPNGENEDLLEQEKPRIVESALSPIQSELMRLGPSL